MIRVGTSDRSWLVRTARHEATINNDTQISTQVYYTNFKHCSPRTLVKTTINIKHKRVTMINQIQRWLFTAAT